MMESRLLAAYAAFFLAYKAYRDRAGAAMRPAVALLTDYGLGFCFSFRVIDMPSCRAFLRQAADFAWVSAIEEGLPASAHMSRRRHFPRQGAFHHKTLLVPGRPHLARLVTDYILRVGYIEYRDRAFLYHEVSRFRWIAPIVWRHFSGAGSKKAHLHCRFFAFTPYFQSAYAISTSRLLAPPYLS